jgi:hypothetical protein
MNQDTLCKIINLQGQLIALLRDCQFAAPVVTGIVSIACSNKMTDTKPTVNNVVQALFASRPKFPISRRWRHLTGEEKNAIARFYAAGIRAGEIAEKFGCRIGTVYRNRKYIGHRDATGCDSVWNTENLLAQAGKASPKVAQCESFVHRLNQQVF